MGRALENWADAQVIRIRFRRSQGFGMPLSSLLTLLWWRLSTNFRSLGNKGR